MLNDEMSVEELVEKRLKENFEELGRRNYDDPNRSKIASEAKTLSEIKVALDSNELTRLNNNAKNDIEEQKLFIEQKKLENERKKIGADIGKVIVYTVGSFGLGIGGYLMDTIFQKSPFLQRLAEKTHDLIVRK